MTDNQGTSLVCPKCREPMEELPVGDCMVDRCTGCAGIWLDANERLQVLQHKQELKAVDSGSVETGREQDEITEINCPRCDEAMRHVSDRAQKHIEFEHCPSCQGTFFDAGELTDLADFTLSERIQSFFGR